MLAGSMSSISSDGYIKRKVNAFAPDSEHGHGFYCPGFLLPASLSRRHVAAKKLGPGAISGVVTRRSIVPTAYNCGLPGVHFQSPRRNFGVGSMRNAPWFETNQGLWPAANVCACEKRDLAKARFWKRARRAWMFLRREVNYSKNKSGDPTFLF